MNNLDNSHVSKDYVPYQPGFEQKCHYLNYILPIGHPLYGTVSDFYQFDVISPEDKICVIPDGCIDILFCYNRDGVTKTLEGYHRKIATIPASKVGSAFGVRFALGGLSSIISIQASDFIEKQIFLMDLFKRDELLDRMEEAHDFNCRIKVITKYLLKMLHRSQGSAEIVKYCNKKIIISQGNILIRDLSKETGYSMRYLRNLYQRYVGVSPKKLCEIIQFQISFLQFTHLQKKNYCISMGDFAVHAGYYDQSHMNKCYQKMVGCLPIRFYNEVNRMEAVTIINNKM